MRTTCGNAIYQASNFFTSLAKNRWPTTQKNIVQISDNHMIRLVVQGVAFCDNL